jgi:long-chain acyl-CoA synthetase
MDYLALSVGGELVYTSRRRIKEDLKEVRPTIFAAVPRIWESLHDGIISHCDKLPGIKRGLMHDVLTTCRQVGSSRAGFWQRLKHAVYRRTLLRPLENVTGGRLRIAVSGGGALPPHVDHCLLGIGLPLLNGYGLTETSPVVAVRPPNDNRAGTIGLPIPHTEVEIRDPEGRPVGRGKTGVLWVRGPQVMRGYYRSPDLTEAVLSPDGWFNSGDLAHIDDKGHIVITGRAKDTIVLAGGENVEPEPVETGIKASPLIDQAVVLGQDEKSLGAILIPMLDGLARRVPREAWDERDGELHGKDVHVLFRQELDRLLTRQAGFRPCERVTRFRLRTEPMTVENGLLTPTLKVKRREVERRMANTIARLFAD